MKFAVKTLDNAGIVLDVPSRTDNSDSCFAD